MNFKGAKLTIKGETKKDDMLTSSALRDTLRYEIPTGELERRTIVDRRQMNGF
jgi:hypothetical protein